MKFLDRLNPEQRKAVEAPRGMIRVLAGAGTGKTTCLTAKIALEIERGMDPKKILALTFTKKAAAELKHRLKNMIGDKALELYAGTFHSFAHSHLSKVLDYRIITDDDVYEILKTVTEDYNNLAYKIDDLIQVISFHRNLRKPYTDPMLAKIESEYKAFKIENKMKDYDDLLTDFLALLEENVFKFQFDLVLTDEAQDNSVVQSLIIKELVKSSKNLFIIGDLNQSIYGFRAASVESFLAWREEGCVDFPLTFNYRSTQEVLKVANRVLNGLTTADDLKIVLKNPKPVPDAPKAKLTKVGNVHDEVAYVISKINELRAQGKPYEDMSVLYRAHYHSQNLQMKLTEAKIPFTVWSGQNLMNAKHIQDLISFLRAFVNKNDVLAWSRLFSLMPRIGKKLAAQYAAMVPGGGIQNVNHPSLTPIKNVFASNNEESFFSALESFYMPYIRSEYPEEYRDVASQKFLNMVKNAPDLRKCVSDLVFSDQGEKEATGVILTTIHQAKGLEWDNVFVIGCMDGLFPSLKNPDLQEELRLFYVAVTRAKTNLFCIFPEENGRKQKTTSMFYDLILKTT